MSNWTNPLLPQNQTRLEAAVATATETSILPDVIATLWDADRCPGRLLPWLAWALSVDEWDETWDEVIQRRVIAASIGIHRKKGTVAAVRQALTSLGHTGRVIEWWQTSPQGAPYTFQAEVEIGNRGLDYTAVVAIDRQIVAVKPVRSHFTLRLIGRSEALVSVACTALSGELTTIQPLQLTNADAPALMFCIGASLHSFGPTTVYPLQ